VNQGGADLLPVTRNIFTWGQRKRGYSKKTPKILISAVRNVCILELHH